MKAQYEKVVRLVCGDNWNSESVSPDERDGGYGVAVCLACLQGSSFKPADIADAIGCPPHYFEFAYKRLQANRVLRDDSPILRDTSLLMNNANTEDEMMSSIRAWCNVAGLASGFIGVGLPRHEYQNRRGAR